MGIEGITRLLLEDYLWLSIALALIVLLAIAFIILLRNYAYKQVRKKAHVGSKKILKIEIPLILIFAIITTQIILNNSIQHFVSIDQNIHNLTSTLLVLAVTYLLIVITNLFIDQWGKHLRNQRRDSTHEEIVPLAKSVADIILILIALFFILQLWGVKIGALLASLGIAGVILGFAFQDTMKNMFGGLALISDDSFRKGDLIELPDGEMGYVVETNLRSTKIKNFGSQQVVVPNGQLANMKIKNYALPTKITRIRIELQIDKKTDLKKAEQAILECVKNNEYAIKYPKPALYYDKIGPYSADLFTVFHIREYKDMFNAKSEAIKEIHAALKKKGIKLAYPVTQIMYADKEKIRNNSYP